jgi:hypothetical protein
MKHLFFSFSQDDSKAREVLDVVRSKIGTLGYDASAPPETVPGSAPTNPASELLKKASLVIAFLSDQNSHVLFEVGYSFALGKKLILVADLAGGLPSDLASVAAIDYRISPSEIAFEIIRRIDALEGKVLRPEAALTLELGDILAARKMKPEFFEKISSEVFEDAIRTAFNERGFTVEIPDPSQDYGFDFRVVDPTREKSLLVEVKKYNPNSKISIASVQQLLGAVHAYHGSAGLLICTSDFTASARGFASGQGEVMRLWTTKELDEFFHWHPGTPTIEDLLSFPIRPNVFKGDRTQFGAVNIDAPIQDGREPSCHYYSEPFAAAAKRADERGDVQGAETYRFLQAIVSFHPSFDTPQEPFVPWIQMEGKRSPIPSDLSFDDILALRELATFATDPALRSRLYDVLWEVTKEHTACAEAVDSYIVAAERLNTPDQWVHAAECFQRAVQLAAKLGRENEPFQRASTSVESAARGASSDQEKFRCARYLRIILENRIGDPVEFARIAGALAERASAAGDPYQARAYWQIEAELQRTARNSAAERLARLAAAESYIIEAESRTQGNAPSAMAAASLLTNGIEALRNAGAPRERIEQLRQRLSELQQASLEEMKTFSTQIDISEMVKSVREFVGNTTFRDALFKFALGQDLIDLKKLRETVIEQAQQTPLLHLLGASVVDQKGRTTVQKPGLLNLQGEELEQQIEAEMFSTASRFMWSLRASSYIEPGRSQIFSEHHPTIEELGFIVRDNPFVPSGHEGIFLRGIHAGFNGDFLIASHLLVPQIENSLRYVLESNGVDVSNLMSDGTQPVKVLGALFGMKQAKEIFGESLCFELRGCLIEKAGYEFRNRVAHGFVSERDCYSAAAAMAWWLVLRICLIPVYQAGGTAAGGTGDTV